MRRLDFISQGPQLSIFKAGSNQTNLGGVLYLIYILVLILLAIIYFFDYFNNEKYEYDYTFVKRDLNEKVEDDDDMSSALYYDLNCSFILGKEAPSEELFSNHIMGNNNFLIVDVSLLGKKLYEEEPDETDGYTTINTNW